MGREKGPVRQVDWRGEVHRSLKGRATANYGPER